MDLLPKRFHWAKFECAQKRAKKPRIGRTSARFKMLLDKAYADIAARRNVSMEYGFRRAAAKDKAEAEAKRRKQ